MVAGSNVETIGTELLTILAIFGGIYILSSGKDGYKWLRFGKRTRIDSIYQLLPILQKNVKVVFLIFSDFATAINSVRGQNDSPLSRDVIKSALSQEHFSELLKHSQEQVLKEFNVDSIELKKALKKFSHDDQVSMYNVGVNQMYNTVLDGGYPQCPGFEIPESLTRDCMLRILEKVIIGKLTGHTDEKVISEEMKRYGYDNTLDALVAFKSAENSYNYDYSFIKERNRLTEKIKNACSNQSVQMVNAEELNILIDTADSNTPIYLAVFDDSVDPSLLDHLQPKPNAIYDGKNVPKEKVVTHNDGQNGWNEHYGHHNGHYGDAVNGGPKTEPTAAEACSNEFSEHPCGDVDQNGSLWKAHHDDHYGVESNAVTCWTFKCNLTPGIKVSSFPVILCFKDSKVEVYRQF